MVRCVQASCWSSKAVDRVRGFIPGLDVLPMAILLCSCCLLMPKANGQGGFDVTAPGGVGWILPGSTVSLDSFNYYIGSSLDAADYLDSNFLYPHMQYISMNKYSGEMNSLQTLDTNYFWNTIWADAILSNDSSIIIPLTSGKTPYPTYLVRYRPSDFAILEMKKLDPSQTLNNQINVARFYKSRFGGYYVLGRLHQAKRTTVWRLDDSLNLQWTFHYPIVHPFYPYEAENGDLLMGGRKFIYKSDCWTNEGTCFSTMQFVRIDSSGKLLSYKENSDGMARQAYAWHVANDSTFIFLSGKGRIDTIYPTSYVQITYQRGLMQMNQELEEISYKTILSDSFYLSPNDYFMLEMRPIQIGNGLIAVGVHDEFIPESDLGPYYRAYTNVIKLTEMGDSVWHRQYIHQVTGLDTIVRSSRPYNLVTNPDGSMTISGACYYTTLPEFGGGQDFWILYLDSFGCVVPGCQEVTSVEEADPAVLDIRIYPNPVRTGTPLGVYIGEVGEGDIILNLYDMQGTLILQQPVRHVGVATYLLQIPPNIRSGMYVLQAASTEGRIWSGKIVVE
jgi:hypothetical protein